MTAIAFLDARVHLDDAFLSTSLGALEQDSSLGMVGAWMLADPDADRILVPPLPARPDLGWGGHFEPCVLVRAEALATAIRAAGDTGSGLSRREVLDQVASSGWGGSRTRPRCFRSFRALSPRPTSPIRRDCH
ncbi:hypothetical protein [Thermomonas carbonis]|uniref:Uncharacterized protein n=1 Tax=Thermomonas carbonis TaxID=1463158 RepID=A0A7G9SMR6_9GAMM|nr:hypothetical protein [Thermomonas carbonis]QNN69141.1 hypothetical protein H9L16_10565 [Thermomonas carbonis]